MRIMLAALLLLSGCSRPTPAPSPPPWSWSEPFYAPPGANVACGAGGKACG